MRYLVTGQSILFTPKTYEVISIEKSLEMLRKLDVIGVDTETMGFDPYTRPIVSLQMGNREFQIMVDCTTINIEHYREILEDEKLLILHNAKFDLKYLYHHRITPNYIYDTYLAEKLLYQGYPPGQIPMGLADLTQKYLSKYLNKSLRGKLGLGEDVVKYGCEDVEHLEDIRDKQLDLLIEKKLTTAIMVENEFVRVLAYCEYSGIKLDRSKWWEKMQQDEKALNEAKFLLDKWIIEESRLNPGLKKYTTVDLQGNLFTGFNTDPICTINWNSSQQLIPLFEYLGFKLLTKDKRTGEIKKSVEAKILELQKDVSTLTPIYLDYTSKFKVVSTYGQNILDQINPVSGRIHTNFNQLMDTGRLSCGGKNKQTGEEYINLQNLPSDELTRSSFIAEEGNLLIDCDYTAQEDLVFTELSQESKLIAFYNDKTRKRDGHSYVAKICFPKELAEVSEEDVKNTRPDLRALAKKAKFSIHYGGNGTTIARNLAIPVEDGLAIENAYLSGFNNINEYFKRVKKEMWENGYILISKITGHKMFIPDWEELKGIEKDFNYEFWARYREIKSKDPNAPIVRKVKEFFKSKSGYERNALNAPVQGTSAIITKLAGVKYFNHLKNSDLLFKVWIVNIVHDEYLIEAPGYLAEEEAKWLQKCMEEAGSIFVKSVTLKAIPEIAKHWVH